MLMKYKDFKTMSPNEMKEIKGGNAPAEGGWCRATATCQNGSTVTLTCNNASSGCSAEDYGSPGYSGAGKVYCSENGSLVINMCPSVQQ